MIDGTVDGGGHAAAIMKKIMPGGKLPRRGLGHANGRSAQDERLATRTPRIGDTTHGNYADLPAILAKEKLGKADGLLLDLGFSSEQLAHSGRGFSFGEDVDARAAPHDL